MKHNSRMQTLELIAFILVGSYLKSQVFSANLVKGSPITDQLSHYGTPGPPADSNIPGARNGSPFWKDASGNFWLLGGFGYDYSSTYDLLNDLWKYNPGTNQWTLIKGDSTGGNGGVYGTIGVAAATNKPGGRSFATTWADGSGNLWLFGGLGYDASSNMGEMNDLWKYNISSN